MSKQDKHALLIYGAGKVGVAVGHLLSKREYPVTGAVIQNERSSKNVSIFIPHTVPIMSSDTTSILEASSTAKIILITTKDEQIKPACDKLVGSGIVTGSHTVIHMSGAIGLDALDSAAAIGADVASIHPIQSFASIELAIKKIPGSYFGITTKDKSKTRGLVLSIVEALNGNPIDIADENKTIYHVAACTASNYLVTLLDLARLFYNAAGIPDNTAIDVMMPLVEGTVSNIKTLGPEQALTGPIARGDEAIIAHHIEQLKQLEQIEKNRYLESGKRFERLEKTNAGFGLEPVEVYKLLGRLTVGVALRKGSIDQNTADNMISLLDNRNAAVR